MPGRAGDAGSAGPPPRPPRRQGRDRDASGRARNARPRDTLGRPLARDADGEPAAPDEPALPPARALAAAQRLINAGRPFHAHEVLEATWKAAPPAERDLWRGLAQLAVGLTHASRGNARGAAALLRRGADLIGPYGARGSHDTGGSHGAGSPHAARGPRGTEDPHSTEDPHAARGPRGIEDPYSTEDPRGTERPHGVDAAAVAAAAIDLATRIDAAGLAGLPPGALRLRLYSPDADAG